MLTLNLMRLSLLIIAGFSAVSSVVGLGSVFRGAFWPIVILGCGLELGKYVGTAYAYQKWKWLPIRFKLILVGFIVTISTLTSVGIFGYLGDSFQKSHATVQKDDILINQLSAEKSKLEARLVEMDSQVAALPADFVNGRLKLMNAFADERKRIEARLSEINPQLMKTTAANVDSVGDLGPVVVLAKTFSTTVDTAVGNMILAIAIILDPFALFLTVLINRQPVAEIVEPIKKRVRKQKMVKEKPVTTTNTDWKF